MAQLKTQCGWENLNFTDNDQGFEVANTHHPETKEHGQERVRANIDQQKALCKTQGSKLVADIRVSHGFFVDETALALGHQHEKTEG